MPALWEATHPRYALVRLHGRNRATWNVKGQTSASDRFNYDYPDGELRDMVPSIERLALTAMQTHVIFNNTTWKTRASATPASLHRPADRRRRAMRRTATPMRRLGSATLRRSVLAFARIASHPLPEPP